MARLTLILRRVDVFATAFAVWSVIKATQRCLRIRVRALGRDPLAASDAVADAVWSRTHAWAANRIKRLAKRRAALWLKFAQYIASRADILPAEYTTALVDCLDAVPPEAPDVIVQTVREALGGREPDEVFEGFDPAAPVASASIAQVFRAKLRETGETVALKVQRRGVRELLHQDLVDLKRIMEMVAGAEPEFDFRPMMDAWIDNVPNECDFTVEAANSDAVRAVLEDARGTEFESASTVPLTYPRYTTERLLVMEWIEGCSILDVEALEAARVDYDRLISEITKAFALQVHFRGLATADSHPGNIICDGLVPGGDSVRPVLIDFGITFQFNHRERLGFARMILAAVDNSSFMLLQSFQDMGIVLNRADPSASMAFVRHLFRSTASREETVRQSKEFFENMKKRQQENIQSGIAVEGGNKGRQDTADMGKKMGKVKLNPVDALPGYFVFSFRAIALLRGLASRLGVDHAYLPILARYSKHVLLDACPPHERIETIVYPQPEDVPVSLRREKSKRLRIVLTRVLEMLSRRGLILGCQISATLNGEVVLEIAAGQMGRYNPRHVTPSSLFNVFSVSKGVMSILYAIVADKHGIHSDDFVAKHWPEFACHGKENTLVKHILGHSAGLAHAAPSDMSMIRLRDDWQGVVKFLAEEAKPAHPPGERSEYHYLSYGWIMAGLLEAVTEKSAVVLLQEFADMLGVRNECFLGLPDELCRDDPDSRVVMLHSQIMKEILGMMKQKRQATSAGRNSTGDIGRGRLQSHAARSTDSAAAGMDALYGDNAGGDENETDPSQFVFELIFGRKTNIRDENGDEESRDAESVFARTPYLLDPEFFSHEVMRAAVIPSANMHTSARALARMYGVLANKGKLPDTPEIMHPTRPHKLMEVTHEAGKKAGGMGQSPLAVGQTFGAGFCLYDAVDKNEKLIEKGAVGHGGLGGSNAFAVPGSRFSFAFTCNQLNMSSVAETIVTGITCHILDVPMPVRHFEAFKLMRSAFDEENSIDETLAAVEQAVDNLGGTVNIGQALMG